MSLGVDARRSADDCRHRYGRMGTAVLKRWSWDREMVIGESKDENRRRRIALIHFSSA